MLQKNKVELNSRRKKYSLIYQASFKWSVQVTYLKFHFTYVKIIKQKIEKMTFFTQIDITFLIFNVCKKN